MMVLEMLVPRSKIPECNGIASSLQYILSKPDRLGQALSTAARTGRDYMPRVICLHFPQGKCDAGSDPTPASVLLLVPLSDIAGHADPLYSHSWVGYWLVTRKP